MSVILYKIDERLVHGQVVASFAKYLSADEFIIVNDKVAYDDDQITLMELAIPAGTEMQVITCAEFKEVVDTNGFWGKKTIVVFRYLTDVMECIQLGVKIDRLNCAGFFQSKDKPNAIKYNNNLFLDDEDKANLRKLADMGVDLYYQLTFVMQASPLTSFVKF
ncbi:MAG: PTS system mannose-specific IIA component [Erysipelotrichaceae bacterium]|nr:MAG: PTS system mannose-specific IIA [Erysipelotrichaceae bacterium]TXT19120.1 MAG: PTS system mannose-specific IIA component [Erysipelotrichaceae bacterium]